MAREYRGIEQERLYSMLGGMPIDGIERGTIVPTPSQIKRMVMVLRFPYEFFTKPMSPDPFAAGASFFCERAEPCANDECGMDAVALCDFPVAGGGTCDAAICPEHGKRVGANRDYCWKHVAMMKPKRRARQTK